MSLFDLKNILPQLDPSKWGVQPEASSSSKDAKKGSLSGMAVTKEDVALNLNTMKETLAQGKEVDAGFIEILSNDIESLKESSQDVTDLSKVLSELADKILLEKVDGKNEKSEKQPSEKLVQGLVSIEDYAKELPEQEKITDEIAGIDALFYARPVAKDGHCFFRAVGYRVVEQFLQMDDDEQKEFLKNIDAEIPEKALVTKKLFESFQKKLTQAATEKKNEDTLMNDPTFSNLVVAFLRRLACEENKKEKNETLEAEANRLGKSVEQYLQDMSDMDKKLFAGQPEIEALANALDINIQVLDLYSDKPFGKYHNFNKDGDFDVPLLYRPGHFDLASRKGLQV